jgi:hypothetical protein
VVLRSSPEGCMMQANGQIRTPASLQESAAFQPFRMAIKSLVHDGRSLRAAFGIRATFQHTQMLQG